MDREAFGRLRGSHTMLLIIGGAPRTGKGILARRLLVETHLPYLSLDVLKMGLVHAVPSLGIDPDASSIAVAEQLWPLVRAMAVNMIETGVPYIIEGEILPKHVEELDRLHPGEVRACFLGYADIEPDQKLREIREFGGHPNDWTSTSADAEVLELIENAIEFSRHLSDECARLGIAYFDTSHGFLPTLDRAATYLRD
jgi:hypothetical protein